MVARAERPAAKAVGKVVVTAAAAVVVVAAAGEETDLLSPKRHGSDFWGVGLTAERLAWSGGVPIQSLAQGPDCSR